MKVVYHLMIAFIALTLLVQLDWASGRAFAMHKFSDKVLTWLSVGQGRGQNVPLEGL